MLECNFTPFPVLHTQRLNLRRCTEADAETVFFLRTDPVVMQYIDREPEQSLETTKAFIKRVDDTITNNDSISWTIALNTNNDQMIGTISLWRLIKEHYRAEIGYVLHTDYHGQGIMHEAMLAVLNYAFTVMGLHSIEANINPNNEASRRLLEKNNFVKEAHFREDYYFKGKFYDSVIYSLLTPLNNQ